MARKKKETTEEVVETVEETKVGSVIEESKNAPKPRAKKTVKSDAEQKQPKRNSKKQEIATKETTETTVASEELKKEELEKKEKPKRGRKPAVKTAEKPQEEKLATEQEVEVKDESRSQEKKTLTRAEKNVALRTIVKELLSERAYKWSELLEESGKKYQEKTLDADGKNVNDLRGRIGSVVDVMKKDGEVLIDGGMYALNTGTATNKQREEKVEESKIDVIQPQIDEKKEEKSAKSDKETVKTAPVFDLSLLLAQKDEKKGGMVENNPIETPQGEKKADEKQTEKPREKQSKKKTVDAKKTEKAEEKKVSERKTQKQAETKLKENFLKKIRSLGGAYFEYFSVYLLERYSLKNGRRIDAMRVSGGEYDGGIDGEIEVTDAMGFKETIYIQAKNWNPMSGKDEGWIVGETHLQQFIGAVCYRQAKEGKQHSRGIFVTTSYFSSGAKEMLKQMSDKFVGYDGDDLFETAKECSFGLVQKDGVWSLDEKLLAGDKAFFNMY